MAHMGDFETHPIGTADRLKALEDALAPFAALAWKGTIWESDFEPPESIVFFSVATGTKVTKGDFARAREVANAAT